MTPIRVVLIEDHDLTRVGMRMALQQSGIEVAGEAAAGVEGLKLVEQHHPDVAIVDIGLPDIDGVEVTRRIKETHALHSNGSENGNGSGTSEHPETRVLILTLRDNEQVVLAAFAAGADSYCMKDVSSDNLLEAIQLTHSGSSWIDPAVAGVVLQQMRRNEPAQAGVVTATVEIGAADSEYTQIIEAYPLTERELEVLAQIVEGCSNAQIAEKLYITVGTVKTHVRNILNKLCADDRTQAAVRALRSGLVK
ncbi:response regulator transcription factor [Leptolyngbya sp. FACHB-261]|uniref:response regulator n=1 Tax=Leptolyngbya sp. FACHB-261 TaxID=2692806 RepID=UPI001684187C|nr:response regulator transcription factor [Leptolyngbya sp. FACHB-261]MBD2102924.1 response regulator transcription factor [Leptolyngbya sp. FACHB-261]